MGYLQGACWDISDCSAPVTSSVFPHLGQRKVSAGLTTAPIFNKTTNGLPTRCSTGPEFSTCRLQDPYCTFQGSQHALDGLTDVCQFWDSDSSCSGSRTLAPEAFSSSPGFWSITANPCFLDPVSRCTASNPVGRMSAFSAMRDWMRSPECSSFIHLDPTEGAPFYETCCGSCYIYADTIDIYYWPEPNANTSCLSIIGDDPAKDVAYGATTGPGTVGTYWGCVDTASGSTELTIEAILTSVGSLTFRSQRLNPWDDYGCKNTADQPIDTLPTILPSSADTKLHTLTAVDGHASTAVVGTNTLYVLLLSPPPHSHALLT